MWLLDVVYVIIALLAVVLSVILIRFWLKWTIGKCKSTAKMTGKVVIVTGANTGIGYFTAKDLAVRGARVILACRNEEKGVTAQNKLIEETGNNDVVYKNLNMSSLKSVRKFARDILETEQRLDVLVNNAGIYGFGDSLTEDGNVEGMQVNYFSSFLLTLLLLPLLKKSGPSRIVNVNSALHYFAWFNTRHLNEKGHYGEFLTYANSKLCNMLFTVELARRLEGTGVVVNALHPGVIHTDLLSPTSSLSGLGLFYWICARTPEDGAQTSIYLAVAEESANVTGRYFVDCKASWMKWTARNATLAKELWSLSEKIVEYVDCGNMETLQC